MSALRGVLVTGASGFVGRVVAARWSDVVEWPSGSDLASLPDVQLAVSNLLGQHEFDAVLHLAAQASPRISLQEPIQTWAVNLQGTVNLIETLHYRGWKGTFLYVSTGAVYGQSVGTISEQTATLLKTPYVASKLAAEIAVLEWGRRTGNRVVVVRPFNHSGPGQTTHYFLPSVASQLAALPDQGGTIEVGNLDVHKDFTHVDDVVDAYRLLLEEGRPQEIYNLASGESQSLRWILDELATLSGKPVEYVVSSERYREESPDELSIERDKILAHVGWEPKRELQTLLRDLMNDWKSRTCQKQPS